MLGTLLEVREMLQMMNSQDVVFSEAEQDQIRRLKVEILDADKFIEANDCKEVTNPIIFYHGEHPTEDGLLSEVIFGITTEERSGIFGYIDLTEQFIQPFYYKIWLKLDKNLRACIYETDTFRLDENGYLVPDPNGEMGLPFLIKNVKKLGFKDTKRTDMLRALQNGQKKDELFTTKLIVIPPYYRDVDTKSGSRMGIGEINKLYQFVLNNVKALIDANDFGMESKGPTRGMIQDLLMEIYNWFTVGESIIGGEHTGSGIFKKFGVMRRSVMSKTTDNSARLVISAPKINVESTKDFIADLDHCALPLSAACAVLYPFMIFHLERYFFNEFSGNTRYPYAYPDGSVKWIELDNPLIQFSNDRFDAEMNEFIHGYSNRFKPVTVKDVNGNEYKLGFKGYYISEEEFAQGKRESGNFLQRPLTWVDILYQCACLANEGKHYVLTRYPVNKSAACYGNVA